MPLIPSLLFLASEQIDIFFFKCKRNLNTVLKSLDLCQQLKTWHRFYLEMQEIHKKTGLVLLNICCDESSRPKFLLRPSTKSTRMQYFFNQNYPLQSVKFCNVQETQEQKCFIFCSLKINVLKEGQSF